MSAVSPVVSLHVQTDISIESITYIHLNGFLYVYWQGWLTGDMDLFSRQVVHAILPFAYPPVLD